MDWNTTTFQQACGGGNEGHAVGWVGVVASGCGTCSVSTGKSHDMLLNACGPLTPFQCIHISILSMRKDLDKTVKCWPSLDSLTRLAPGDFSGRFGIYWQLVGLIPFLPYPLQAIAQST